MKDRRDFLKASLLGAGVLSTGIISAFNTNSKESVPQLGSYEPSKEQQFNMCGYAAPKLEKVRIGFVGIGDRGASAVERISFIEGVEIVALCDIRQIGRAHV